MDICFSMSRLYFSCHAHSLRRGKGGSCHEVTIVNFQFHESLRSWKKSDHNAVKFSYEFNFRHSRFISYLFTIHSQGLLHFTPHRIHFNHDSRNSFFIKSRFTEHKKKQDHGVTKIPLPPLFSDRWTDVLKFAAINNYNTL